jgi:hypothetical protein
MTLDARSAVLRDVQSSMTMARSTAMNTMHEELARAQLRAQHEEANRHRRRRAILAHRRWHRRAQHAAHRARLALAVR